MTASDRPETDRPSKDWSLLHRLPGSYDDVVLVVACIALLALVARFVLLGDRIAHWDEGRVGYWIIHYQETGSFAYRRIIHGPFIQHVNRWLFPLAGANDFTMRVPVALVGGLLPLSALLFREHLRRIEMVAMAFFLSFTPVLLYYSRFMRSDLLVATFMFVAFGLFVRLYDTRKPRYLYAAAAFVAFGFASKENAAIYVLTWLGALGLLADQALYRPRAYDSGYALVVDNARGIYLNRFVPWLEATRSLVAALFDRSGLGTDGGRDVSDLNRTPPTSREQRIDALSTVLAPVRYLLYGVVAGAILCGLLLFFYAPRGAGMEGVFYPPADASSGAVGFWQGFSSPSAFTGMVDGTWAHASEEFGTWFQRATEGGDRGLVSVFVKFLGQFLQVMVTKAAPLTAFAIFGFIVERYGSATSRNLVLFASYGGFVSVLGYPLATDVFGGWLVVHALIPLAIPAAVGLGRIFTWGYESFALDDSVGVAIAGILLLLVVGQVGAVAVPSVYVNDQSDDNHLVQYAQPGGNPRPAFDAMAAIGRENRTGTDVLLYYGEQGDAYDGNLAYVEEDPSDWASASMDLQPLCSSWHNTLPLPWYFAQDDVDVSCSRTASNLSEQLGSSPPPMVITQDADSTVPTGVLQSRYDGTSYEMRSYGKDTTFWIRSDWANTTG